MPEDTQVSPVEAELFREVYVPRFIEKCAEAGLAINTAEELDSALEGAALVKAMTQQSHGGEIKQAAAELRAAAGIPQVVPARPEDGERIKAASAGLAGRILTAAAQAQAAAPRA